MLARLIGALCCGRARNSTAEIERLTRLLEAERLEKEREREEKEREHLRAERLAKDNFLGCMRGMSSSSAAESASGSDVWRRGAPIPDTVSLATLLPDLTAGGPAECAAAWAAGCRSARDLALPAPLPSNLKETTHLHPLLNSLLRAATPPQLRLWWERVAADDVPHSEAKPDFLVTRARDAQPSLLGAVAIVEVKLPGAIEKAVSQACAYMRRRIFKLVSESDARGEDLSSICTWGVATDGEMVVLLRMRSGAPLAPATFEHCEPCPVESSPPLALLNWAWRDRPQPPLEPSAPLPSPGFAALVHLLSTACSVARAWEGSLSVIHVHSLMVAGEPGGGAAARSTGSCAWICRSGLAAAAAATCTLWPRGRALLRWMARC